MANTQKPTPRTRHMGIKYKVLCEWVERELEVLERVETKLNMADHFTKQLGPLLFHRHTDYIMGRVQPQYSSHFKNVHGLLKQPWRVLPKESYRPPTAAPATTRPTAAAAAKLAAHWTSVTSYYCSQIVITLD